MATWYGITDNGTLTVRVGSGGEIETNLDPSAPANVWVARTSGVTDILRAIAWNGTYFVAVGDTGTIIYSTDGITWASATSGVSTSLNDIAAGGIVFLAVGDSGVILQSQDATVWAAVTSGTTNDLWSVAIGNGDYTIVGDDSTILTGALTTTVLEVELLEQVGYTDLANTDGSSLVATATDDFGHADVTGRIRRKADTHIVVVTEQMTTGEEMTHEKNASDPQTGIEESISGSSSPVITEQLVTYEPEVLSIWGGAGSGEPLLNYVVENMLLSRLGTYEAAVFVGSAGVIDSAGLSDRLFDSAEYIREVMSLTDTAAAAYHKLFSDMILVNDTLDRQYLASLFLNETLNSSDTASATGVFSITILDDATLSDTATANQIFNLLISENLTHLAGLSIPDSGTYFGLVINTRNKAITEYDGFDFNSMFEFNGKYYGTNSTGVHELTSTQDAGENIETIIKTGLMDMGETLNRVTRAYIGLRSTGDMVLKTITNDPDGAKRERYYEVKATNASIKTTRVRLLKKVKSRYWQFELVNINGTDFEIDDIDFVNIKLTRRV